MKTSIYFLSYLAKFFLKNEKYFGHNCREKYCRTRQATDYTMAHAHCMLDN